MRRAPSSCRMSTGAAWALDSPLPDGDGPKGAQGKGMFQKGNPKFQSAAPPLSLPRVFVHQGPHRPLAQPLGPFRLAASHKLALRKFVFLFPCFLGWVLQCPYAI